MKEKSNGWNTTFWIVTAICIAQYVFISIPRISQTKNVGLGFYLGSLIPNAVIILIFWGLKKQADKKILDKL